MKANNEEETEIFTEDEIYIATLLCHFLELMQFNSHEVAQVTTDNSKKFRTKRKHLIRFVLFVMLLKQMQFYSSVWDGCEEYRRRFKISLYRSSGISHFSNVQSFLRPKHSSILYWKYSLCTGKSKWVAFKYDTFNKFDKFSKSYQWNKLYFASNSRPSKIFQKERRYVKIMVQFSFIQIVKIAR